MRKVTSKNLKTIKVAYYHHTGDFKAINFKKILGTSSKTKEFSLKIVTTKDIHSQILEKENYDVLIIPGGMAPRHATRLKPKGRQIITNFVKNGGGIIGICAGAYLMCKSESGYECVWNWGLIKSEILDLSHWNRGSSWNIKISYSKLGEEIFLKRKKKGKKKFVGKSRYANGPLYLLMDDNDVNISNARILASFENEICKNKAPKDLMKGSPAIICGDYYKGRVIACSPHPEKSPDVYKYHLRNSIRWLAKQESKFVRKI